MAALPRPSLRSTSRKTAVRLFPATVTEHKPSPKPRKRPRDSSLGNDTIKHAVKKQKLRDQEHLLLNSVATCRNANVRGAPVKKSPTDAGTQVAISQTSGSDLVQQAAVGVVTTNSNDCNTCNTNDAGNGIIGAPDKVDKRSLRSQDGGSRSKSELALYFPNYDELVSIEPKESEYLTPETLVHIIDEPIRSATSNPLYPSSRSNVSNNKQQAATIRDPKMNGFPKRSAPLEDEFVMFKEAQRLDFSETERHIRHFTEDPMCDAVYLKGHRRAERQEKQLRNIEKERAQHEKVQLERLLDGLKGHDWLRVMGISGITDSEKKAFEPKRAFFIHEVASLIEKFRVWKEEEKRRKVKKEQNVSAGDEDGDESQAEADCPSDGDPPDYSDVDAWAARQLRQEAISANGLQTSKNRRHRPQPTTAPLLPPEKPFTSFYSKPYLRDAAIGKHRRGRTRFAFGQPVPIIPEQVFNLPSDMLSHDAIIASARSRRRARRESKEERGGPD